MARSRAALFLDRDGVINYDTGYLHHIDQVEFVPGASSLIRAANRLQLPVIVITNQAGIGRGLYSVQQFHELMQAMQSRLAIEEAHWDAVYFSPFHPEHGLGEFRRDTECRKPKPGMLLQAAAEHSLNLGASVLVGDRCTDLQAGAAAGVPHRFLVRGTEPDGCPDVEHQVIHSLDEVTQWLLQHFSVER